MVDIIEKIHSSIRKAGYEYAKYYYEDWKETFKDDLKDQESYYYNSTDSLGHTFKEIFEEQIYEQTYHSYCSGTNDDFFEEFSIEGFSKEERDLVIDDYLYDELWDGICVFIEETYK
ncbi:MAG: hypothetical protein K5683_03320 [Prevotella sp.]|nr:hypothetical protein [Prevotella sp.]